MTLENINQFYASSEHPQFLVIKGSRVGQVYSRLRVVEMGVLPESRVHERRVRESTWQLALYRYRYYTVYSYRYYTDCIIQCIVTDIIQCIDTDTIQCILYTVYTV